MMKRTTWQVGRLFDKNWSPPPVTDRLVGIELEYENVTGLHLAEPHRDPTAAKVVIPNTVWEPVRDGSLRNSGAEFVSSPIPKSTVAQEVETLFRSVWTSSRWQLSIRTGLHIHVDVRDFELAELEAVNTGYCLIEPALFHFVGQAREDSVFCIPWYKAHADCNRVTESLAMRGDPQTKLLRLREPTMSKYDAVNWCPISRLGTIEFRHAANSLDPAWIGQWADICVAVIELGKRYTRQELIDMYRQSPDAFPQRVHKALACPDYEALMLRTGAEFLAHKTLPPPEPDPKNLKNWIRMNDRLTVVRPARDYNNVDWRADLEMRARAVTRQPIPAPPRTRRGLREMVLTQAMPTEVRVEAPTPQPYIPPPDDDNDDWLLDP